MLLLIVVTHRHYIYIPTNIKALSLVWTSSLRFEIFTVTLATADAGGDPPPRVAFACSLSLT
jgi:hypothetical protein